MKELEPPYYRDIDEVLGRAVPAINAQLAEADREEERQTVELDGHIYTIRNEEPWVIGHMTGLMSTEALVSPDDLHAARLTGIPATGTPLAFDHQPVADPDLVKKNDDGRMSVEAEREMRRKVEEITARAMNYESGVRLDIGYLLEVVNAYETGRL